jgi:orotidine-5'-phosphate decarboxylase
MANVGAVLGATVRLADYDIDVRELAEAKSQWPVMPILTPGVGHQGGQLEQVRENFGRLFAGVLINESRSLVEAGPTSLGERIVKRSSLLATFFGGG